MCLAAVAIAQSARFPWVLASNRDEFFNRAAAPLGWWQPAPGSPAVLGGRDLAAGGTWLGVTASGRLALVTNLREPGRFDPAAPSRGTLVTDALAASSIDEAWLDGVLRVPRNGFNLLVAELPMAGLPMADLQGATAVWAGNHPPARRRLGAGVYGLSNAALDTPWPKVVHLKARLAQALAEAHDGDALAAALFATLADPHPAADADLPATGLPLDRERQLSPAFIRIVAEAPPSGAAAPAGGVTAAGPGGGEAGEGDAGEAGATGATAVYGTRCSTLVIAEHVGCRLRVRVIERRYASCGSVEGQTALNL